MVTLLADETPVARISHGCNLCLGRIGVGEKYHRQRIVDYGDAWVFKAHFVCWSIESKMRRDGEWFDEDCSDPGEICDALRSIFTALTGRTQR